MIPLNRKMLEFVGLLMTSPLLQNIYFDRKYIPPKEVEPVLCDDMLEYVLMKLFEYENL